MSGKRQVILFMTDTTRKDMLGCYGDSRMKTPNLDHLAEGGIRYENAYSCQPVCGPARGAIFTGLFPHSNGVSTNSMPLGEGVKTIGQRLTDQDVHCGYIGKWHLDGGGYFGYGKCPEGWDPDYWYDMRCYLEELTEEERVKSRKRATAYSPEMSEAFTYAHRCSDRAIRFLEEYGDEDFFLTVSYDEPHGPSLCPAPFNRMYENFSFDDNEGFHDDLEDKPLMQKLWAGKNLHATSWELRTPTEKRSLFLGCNSFADYEIGRVLKVIDEKMPDALVIYTSDHGDMLGSHHLNQKNAAIYREVANIRGGEKGKIVGAPASHIDLAPTIMDYFGLKIPKCLAGKSMLPQIYDTTKKIHDVVFTEFTRYEVDHDGFGGLQMMRAAVTERYKLALHLMDKDEFYDTKEDPCEVHNLIDDERYATIRDEMHDQILKEMDETRDMYRGYQWAVRPWRNGYEPTWANGGYTRQKEEEEMYEPRQLDYDTGLPMVSAVRRKEQH